MGKEVEGKGRQGKLERDEQYEEARALLAEALELGPPSVYRASLYRDLCICQTKLKRPEDAFEVPLATASFPVPRKPLPSD